MRGIEPQQSPPPPSPFFNKGFDERMNATEETEGNPRQQFRDQHEKEEYMKGWNSAHRIVTFF